jgi:flagellin-specific chaperone FliS
VSSLNFEAGELATDLFRLYEYCLQAVRRQRFTDAAAVLRILKSGWAEGLRSPHC